MTLIRATQRDISKVIGEIQSRNHNPSKPEVRALVANRHDRRTFAATTKSFYKKYGQPCPLTFTQYLEAKANERADKYIREY